MEQNIEDEDNEYVTGLASFVREEEHKNHMRTSISAHTNTMMWKKGQGDSSSADRKFITSDEY